MLPHTEHGSGPVALILMPFLAGTQAEWTEVIGTLGKFYRCVTIDLPGFGEAANIPGYTISEMSDALIQTLSGLNLDRYVLVGHSMAGKLSAVVTRRILDGDAPLHPPIGLVLVAPSPPSPEPMTDAKRSQMLKAFPAQSDVDEDQKQAEKYIKDNSSHDIPTDRLNRTIAEVLKMNRAAWTAWLEGGSKEDWSTQVGIIDLPTLIFAGDNDNALGPGPQAKNTQPFFPQAHLIALDTNHLIPLEEPDELAARISNFIKIL